MSEFAFKPMTVKDVADYLGISVQMVYKMVRLNRIGGVIRFGSMVRFDRTQLDAWILDELMGGKS
jgi:excisionase family DNA binding protein